MKNQILFLILVLILACEGSCKMSIKPMRKAQKSKKYQATLAKAKANVKAHHNSKLITGDEHLIHESNQNNFAINVYEPIVPDTYIAPKKCHDAAAPKVTRFSKKNKNMMKYRFAQIPQEEMRKNKKSKKYEATLAKAKANVKAHHNSKLITGDEHEIHESNVANFAINIYEPIVPEPYAAPKKCHDAASPKVQRFAKLLTSRSHKKVAEFRFKESSPKDKVRKSKKSKKYTATLAKAKSNIKAHHNSKLITGDEHLIHESNQNNFAINVYEPIVPDTYIAPKKCHDAAAPKVTRFAKKLRKFAQKLNSFRKMRFQEMPQVRDQSKDVLTPQQSVQANLFLDNLVFNEENANRDLLEVINQEESSDKPVREDVLDIDRPHENNDLMSPTYQQSLTF